MKYTVNIFNNRGECTHIESHDTSLDVSDPNILELIQEQWEREYPGVYLEIEC